MKSSILSALALIFLTLMACNNPGTDINRLQHEIEDGHNIGMAKMEFLTRAQQKARYLVDSIDRLPAKAQQSAAVLKSRLDSLLKELDYAEFAMDKWMQEYKWFDSTSSKKERAEYLNSEIPKVAKMKEAILSSLRKADTVLRAGY